MPGLVLLNLTLLLSMLSGSGAIADADTLINWGASTLGGTTNGWGSRVVTSLFVHAGPWLFLVNTLALVQAGLIVERLAGHLAFATIYLTAGVSGNLAAISSSPVTLNSGASGAVAGVYGLLVAATMWGLVRKSPLTPPMSTMIGLAPGAILFTLVNGVSGALPIEAEIAGFLTGVLGGLVMTCGVADRKSLRSSGLRSPRAPHLCSQSRRRCRSVALPTPPTSSRASSRSKHASGGTYQRAVGQFRLGTMSASQLARMIERSIMPEIKAARTRLLSLDGVPAEQQALVASAEEYLRLRDESWRLRFEALSSSSMGELAQRRIQGARVARSARPHPAGGPTAVIPWSVVRGPVCHTCPMNSGVAQPPRRARRRLFAIAGAVFFLTTAAGLAWWVTTRQPDRLAPDWIPSTVSELAGTGVPGVRDGVAHTAQFSEPFGVAVAQDGSIFVSDAGDAHRVRRISPTGIVTTIAGGTRGFADGSGRSARFFLCSPLLSLPTAPRSLPTPPITPSVGSLPTAWDDDAGWKRRAGGSYGVAHEAQFNGPMGVAIDRMGRVVVADTYNDQIPDDRERDCREIAGGNGPGLVDAFGAEARFDTPCGVAIDKDGYILSPIRETARSVASTPTATLRQPAARRRMKSATGWHRDRRERRGLR